MSCGFPCCAVEQQQPPEPAWLGSKRSLKKEEKYAVAIGTLLLDKQPDSATQFLRVALNEIPGSFLLQLVLSRSYTAQNKPDEALGICNDILAVNPGQVDVLKLKADLLDKKGMGNEATAILENAYRITPFDVELNYVLALRYAESKNPKLLALCDSLIRADTEGAHAEPYYYKGIYYSNTGDKRKALTLFDDAVQHDYYFLDGYIEKGSILFDIKKYKDALAVFNLALTISPQFADAYYWIAKCQKSPVKEEARVNYCRLMSWIKVSKKRKKLLTELLINNY
jgi:tetratricopeptide (TPR) repeat protein